MRFLWRGIALFMWLTILTGVAYPLLVSGVSQVAFNHQANGSLLRKDNVIVGSELIAQKFQRPEYFWPRPSAADFGTVASGASNLGPTSQKLKADIESRRASLAAAHHVKPSEVPEDLLMASGSGLDPHISLAAARFQVSRIVSARGLDTNSAAKLNALIDGSLKKPQFGILGEARVNVLALNLALEKLK